MPAPKPPKYLDLQHRAITLARAEGMPRAEVLHMIDTLTGGGSRSSWLDALRHIYDESKEGVA